MQPITRAKLRTATANGLWRGSCAVRRSPLSRRRAHRPRSRFREGRSNCESPRRFVRCAEVCVRRARAARAGPGRNRSSCDRPQLQRRAQGARFVSRHQGRDRAAGHRGVGHGDGRRRRRRSIQGGRRSVRRRAVCVCVACPHGRIRARAQAEVDRPRRGVHDSDHVPHRLLRPGAAGPIAAGRAAC